jgi:predicted nucleotidyltransferase
MNAQEAQDIIARMVQRIVEQFNPDKIILFGSRAWGTARPDSDADLLVIMPVSGSRRKQAARIDMALAGMGLSKDIVLVTPEEVEQYGDAVGAILRPALRQGKVLYERPAQSGSSRSAMG